MQAAAARGVFLCEPLRAPEGAAPRPARERHALGQSPALKLKVETVLPIHGRMVKVDKLRLAAGVK